MAAAVALPSGMALMWRSARSRTSSTPGSPPASGAIPRRAKRFVVLYFVRYLLMFASLRLGWGTSKVAISIESPHERTLSLETAAAGCAGTALKTLKPLVSHRCGGQARAQWIFDNLCHVFWSRPAF